jgi:catechol 2,3-dioxygenase-like lactoylglutathione lyase family enzyme
LLIAVAAFGGTCAAQLPEYYKTVNRLVWVVENIDRVRPAWEAFGLSDIQAFPNIQLTGTYRGVPQTIYAWQITGRLGSLTIDMVQPAEGQRNAYTRFLGSHGDGVLAIVHEVPDRAALDREIARMRSQGVEVLQQVTMPGAKGSTTYTFFDTEAEGKYVLGLVYGPGGLPKASDAAVVSHFGAVVWDAGAVSRFWERLGLPSFPMQHATPRPDGRYHGEPLSLAFEVGYQRHTQFRYEWISPPPSPPNIYADFLNRHGREGIQHIGLPVEELDRAVAAYEKRGYRVAQAGAWGDVGKPGSGRYAYMNTDSVGGIVVELLQSYGAPGESRK